MPSSEEYDLAVVGLGPGGLAAALAAARAGKKVVAFTDRKDYIRGQTIRLSDAVVEMLKEVREVGNEEDELFWKEKIRKESDCAYYVQIKDLECYLRRKLELQSNVTIVNVKKGEIDGVERESSGVKINLSGGVRSFCARNVIAADGARHAFAELMNKGLGVDIKYEKTKEQARHPYHCAIQLCRKFKECFLLNSSVDPTTLEKAQLNKFFEDGDGCILYEDRLYFFDGKARTFKEILPPDEEKEPYYSGQYKALKEKIPSTKDVPLKANYKAKALLYQVKSTPPDDASKEWSSMRKFLAKLKLGWSGKFEPRAIMLPNATDSKFYFAGEIPKSIHDAPDDKRNELLKKWACQFIYEKYGYTEEEFEYKERRSQQKAELQATVFKMDMERCEQPFIRLGNGAFAQIGDARRTPYYVLAHGANDSIAGGLEFVRCMGDSNFDGERFSGVISAMDHLAQSSISAIDSLVQPLMPLDLTDDQKKTLARVDKLIVHLEGRGIIDEGSLRALKWARNNVGKSDLGSEILLLKEAVNDIVPHIERHQHRNNGIAYVAWRAVVSFISGSSVKTKSASLLDEVRTSLGPAP